MFYVVGLGNPGKEYEKTRHNIGRVVVEHARSSNVFPEWKQDKKAVALLSEGVVGSEATTFILPETFMNKSGGAVSRFVGSKKAVEKLIVVHDDLDLPLGTIRLAFNRGSAGHKGVESIVKALGTKAFMRLRVGVTPMGKGGVLKKPHGEKAVNDFVLKSFTPTEQGKVKDVTLRAEEALRAFVKEGRERAMNKFN
ncbi:MAG: aminoacyl-tRNA hydrolase [Parcubacteria group bacterium]|nr:aminoacyl-tRNA hydrolase [Parcubacteria group bacterium]